MSHTTDGWGGSEGASARPQGTNMAGFGSEAGPPVMSKQPVITFKPADILDEAKKIIGGERREAYGEANESFNQIANLWMAYLGKGVTAHDVAMCMILLKLVREKHAHKTDNLVDICGYAALASTL